MRRSSTRLVRITHRTSGEIIAEGPPGILGITSFEGNLYIRRKYLKTHRLRPNWIPGLCVYKFLYVWLDLRLADGTREPFVGWSTGCRIRCFPSSRFDQRFHALHLFFRSRKSRFETL